MKFYGMGYEHRPLVAFGDDKQTISQWNPLGRVPVLILDGGEALYESGAILDYLDELAGADKALIPDSGPTRRRILQLMAAATGAAEKAIMTVYEKRFRPEEKWHAPWTDLCGSQVKSGIEALDRQVQGPWMTGDQITHADVTAVCCWDFIKLANPDLAAGIEAPRLDGISAAAGALSEFADTVPPA